MIATENLQIRTLAIGRRNVRAAVSAGRPGSVPLLAFNGLGANLELFDGVAKVLGEFGIGLVTFDVPGIGGSSRPVMPYRLRSLAKLADAVLTEFGIAGQVDVIGVSWGGALAQEFAHRYPARARRLILAATTAGVLAIPGKWSALSKMMSPRRYVDRGYMKRFGGDLYGGKFRTDPELLAGYGTLLRKPGEAGYYYQLFAASGWTSAPWLRHLRLPTLVMVGLDDPIVPPVNGKILASMIPDARLVAVDDGHLFLITSIHECAPIIADFLGVSNAGQVA